MNSVVRPGAALATILALAACGDTHQSANAPIFGDTQALNRIDPAQYLATPPAGAVQKTTETDHNSSGEKTRTYAKSTGFTVTQADGQEWVGPYRGLRRGNEAVIDGLAQLAAGPDGKTVGIDIRTTVDSPAGGNSDADFHLYWKREGIVAWSNGSQSVAGLKISEVYTRTQPPEVYGREFIFGYDKSGHMVITPLTITHDDKFIGQRNNLRSLTTGSFTGIDWLPAGAPVPQQAAPQQAGPTGSVAPAAAAAAKFSPSVKPYSSALGLDRLGHVLSPYAAGLGS